MKTLIEIFDLEDKVEALYNRMFKKYYSGNELNNWRQIDFFGGGNANKYKSEIKRLLNEGKRVKTGYRTSSMIRGSKTFYIFYK
jgi:hypothetical protein